MISTMEVELLTPLQKIYRKHLLGTALFVSLTVLATKEPIKENSHVMSKQS